MEKPELDKKNNESSDKKKFACKLCSVVCSSRYGLAEHIRRHTGDRPFLCTECKASFKRMTGLRKHQQCIHGAPGLKQYNCPDCKFVSANLGNVLRHYLVVHKTLRRFICSICLAQYSQNQELKNHLSAKHDIVIDNINSQAKKSICEVYVLPAFEEKDRTSAIITRLNDIVKVEKEKLKGIEKLISLIKNKTDTEDNCDDAVPLLTNSSDVVVKQSNVLVEKLNKRDSHSKDEINIGDKLQISNISEVTVESAACPETWISFVLEKPTTILYNGICYDNCIPSTLFLSNQEDGLRIDNTELQIISEKTEWKCKICQKSFAEEKKLLRHLKVHSNEKKYKCNKCGKCFREQHNLVVHYRTHTEERPYVCPVCGKQIRYHKDFVDHFVSHSGEKRYTCDYCFKKFPRKRDCDRHMLSHNTEYRFTCDVCGKGFSRRYLMLHHIMKHKKTDNQQPIKREIFECEVCRKQYKTLQRFIQHKTKHTGMSEHQCHICSKSFTSASRLQAHLRNHIPRVKNVTCSVCQRKFSSQDTLKIHMDRFHKQEVSVSVEVEGEVIVLAANEVPNYDYEIIVNNPNFCD